ncbi:hypothetical protein KIPB_013663, partial [Kipferlia bialata]
GQARPLFMRLTYICIVVFGLSSVVILRNYPIPSVLTLSVPVIFAVLLHTLLVWRSTMRLETKVNLQVNL